MPSLLLPRFAVQDMSDKKSPPRKEKPFLVRTPQPDDKGMKRKLLSPNSPTHDDDDKKTPNKRKRGSLSVEVSPMTNQKTPGSGSRGVPLSERQQLAMIKRMSDESTQDPTVKAPVSPPLAPVKKALIDKKVFKRNTRGEMPIHLAAISGDIKSVKKLIKAGADVNVADFAGWTPLHEASNRGWVMITKQLLKAGANVNVQGLDDDTPLHDASINGHIKLVHLLLKHGANPLQPNAKGKTPLDVATTQEMVRILKKENICSASDSSSIDDVRSPMSPDSVNSYKDDDKSVDLDDFHQNNRNELSSSSFRRHTMPKSPDSKLASPRLCLKFHRDSLTNQKSRDSTYSVTNMSVGDSAIEAPMFSPGDSPASSVDSDLYNPNLEHLNISGNRVKITIPDDENSQGSMDFKFKHNSGTDHGLTSVSSRVLDGNDVSVTREVFPSVETVGDTDRASTTVQLPFRSFMGVENIQENKSTLKTTETLPFHPNSQLSSLSNTDDSMELPELEIDTSESIPFNREPSISSTLNETLTNSHKECTSSVTSCSTAETNVSLQNHSNNISSSTVCHVSVVSPSPVPQDTTIDSIQDPALSRSCSPAVDNTLVTDSGDRLTEEKQDAATEAETMDDMSNSETTSDNANVDSTTISPRTESDNINVNVVKTDASPPCSPVRSDNKDSSNDSSKEVHSSMPKVPPLKIIIPPKTQPTSSPSESSEGLKLVVTNVKSALPYVINPYQQQQGGDTEGAAENQTEDTWTANHMAASALSSEVQSPSASECCAKPLDLNVSGVSSVVSDNNNLSKSIVKKPCANGGGVGNSQVKSDEEKCNQSMEISESNVPRNNQSDVVGADSYRALEVAEDSGSSSSKGDADRPRDDREKKEEPTQRVLRSTVRSQQMLSTDSSKSGKQLKPTQERIEKVDKNSCPDSSMSPTERQPTPPPPTAVSIVTQRQSTNQDEAELNVHPRKRKIKRVEQQQPSAPNLEDGDSQDSTTSRSNGVDNKEKVPNPYEIFLSLRKKIAARRQGYLDMLSICPKTPQGFKDYLLKTCNYVLQGNNTSTLSVPTLLPPNSVRDKMREMFVQQEEGRYKLRLQHLIEREKLILSIEQEILREHGRWARVIANQGTPLSVCTILRDQEVYNFTEDQVRLEEKEKKNRTRYNGRQFLSWLQDVDDKYEKIKELLILRQKQEADSLYAYQKLEWEWRMKELALCDRNVTPDIDELHVPLVNVQDNFDLRPT